MKTVNSQMDDKMRNNFKALKRNIPPPNLDNVLDMSRADMQNVSL